MTKVTATGGDKRVLDILEHCKNLHCSKNTGYCSDEDRLANFKKHEKYGIKPYISALVRAQDKDSRIESYIKSGKLTDENVEDCFIDRIVYTAIALALFREEKRIETKNKSERVVDVLSENKSNFVEQETKSITLAEANEIQKTIAGCYTNTAKQEQARQAIEKATSMIGEKGIEEITNRITSKESPVLYWSIWYKVPHQTTWQVLLNTFSSEKEAMMFAQQIKRISISTLGVFGPGEDPNNTSTIYKLRVRKIENNAFEPFGRDYLSKETAEIIANECVLNNIQVEITSNIKENPC